MSGEFPTIKSTHSLVAKHVTKEKWDKLKNIETKTCGFTLGWVGVGGDLKSYQVPGESRIRRKVFM